MFEIKRETNYYEMEEAKQKFAREFLKNGIEGATKFINDVYNEFDYPFRNILAVGDLLSIRIMDNIIKDILDNNLSKEINSSETESQYKEMLKLRNKIAIKNFESIDNLDPSYRVGSVLKELDKALPDFKEYKIYFEGEKKYRKYDLSDKKIHDNISDSVAIAKLDIENKWIRLIMLRGATFGSYDYYNWSKYKDISRN